MVTFARFTAWVLDHVIGVLVVVAVVVVFSLLGGFTLIGDGIAKAQAEAEVSHQTAIAERNRMLAQAAAPAQQNTNQQQFNPAAPAAQVAPALNGNSAQQNSAAGSTARNAAPATNPAASHEQRVRELAPEFWSNGVESWLRKAGYTWDTMTLRARQPEEETFGSDILVSGYQVEVNNLRFAYPAGMTTDRTVSNGRCYKPSPNNASKVCTDVSGFSGTATLWVDVSNWGQLWPQSSAPATPASCPSLSDLAALGSIVERLEYPQGTLAGAQVRFNRNWNPPVWVDQLQKGGTSVDSAIEGEVYSVWVVARCRPLK